MQRYAILPFLALACATPAVAQQARPQWFQGQSDLSIYLKPRFTTPSTWDQQVGVRARLLRYGNFSSEYSIAYDPTYPIKFHVRPKWTTGLQLAYFFTKDPFPIAVYTTPKYNLYSTCKQEFGLNLRLFNSRRVYVNSSLDYQITYPYVQHTTGNFQASLTVGFPLGG